MYQQWESFGLRYDPIKRVAFSDCLELSIPGENWYKLVAQWKWMMRIEVEWVDYKRNKSSKGLGWDLSSWFSASLFDEHFPITFWTGASFFSNSFQGLKVQFIPVLLPHCLAFRKDSMIICVLLLPQLIRFLFTVILSCFPGIYFLDIIITVTLITVFFPLLFQEQHLLWKVTCFCVFRTHFFPSEVSFGNLVNCSHQ